MTRKNPRRRRATIQKQFAKMLANRTVWGKMSRPSQIRAAAKQLSYMPSLVKVMRAA